MPTTRPTRHKPDLTPALRQALESAFAPASAAAVATPAVSAQVVATRAQRRPILQPDLRTAPPRAIPAATPKPSRGLATVSRKSTRAANASPDGASLAPIKALQDLSTVQHEIKRRARLAAEREAARQALEAQARAEKELFTRAVGAVAALPRSHRPGHRAALPRAQAPPIAVQHQRDELAVMKEAISDEFDVETLLDTDESLSFRRPGMGPDVVRKLRRGGWAIQSQLDLHGMRRDDAREALGQFVKDAMRMGWRCVRVVHGKGLGSPGKTPVLKGKVQSWLIQKTEVLAFVQARPAHGGAGALLVLLDQG